MNRRVGAREFETGQAMVEYGLLAGLIAILCVASVWLMTEWVGQKYLSENDPDESMTMTNEFDAMMDQIGATSGLSS